MSATYISLRRLLELLVKSAQSSFIAIVTIWIISVPLNLARAEEFPSRTVTFVEPGPPGGSPDTVVRILGEKLSQKWGVPVVVENKPGATGMIGAESIARGEASGHRLLFTFTALIQAPAVFSKVPYDLDRDFQPVSLVVTAPVMLAVAQESPIKTLSDLIKQAKNAKKPISYGSFGFGSSYHIYGEALKLSQQIDLLHVPYKGEALELTALLGGQIDSAFLSIGVGTPYIRAGKIRGLAVVSKTRSTVLPDIPTFHEAGVDGIDAVGWFGVLAPSGTPADRVQKVANDIADILHDPAVVGRLRNMGFEPIGNDPKAFREFLQIEAKKWKSLINKIGLHVQN